MILRLLKLPILLTFSDALYNYTQTIHVYDINVYAISVSNNLYK